MMSWMTRVGKIQSNTESPYSVPGFESLISYLSPGQAYEVSPDSERFMEAYWRRKHQSHVEDTYEGDLKKEANAVAEDEKKQPKLLEFINCRVNSNVITVMENIEKGVYSRDVSP